MADYILQVAGLNKKYGALHATRNLNFTMQRGHIHALIGPNGAGKTTVVNQLTGDIIPDSGSILYNSKEVSHLKDYQRAALGIARSFQITHIFENLTVAENMALSLCAKNGHNFRFFRHCLSSKPVVNNLEKALERVDLAHRANESASSLSHGEKRQLEVGMALTGDPELLILDEPMAGMGPGGTVELSQLILKLKGTISLLLVEHDMDVVFSLADMITVLVYGENIITGPPELIKENTMVRDAYLGE